MKGSYVRARIKHILENRCIIEKDLEWIAEVDELIAGKIEENSSPMDKVRRDVKNSTRSDEHKNIILEAIVLYEKAHPEDKQKAFDTLSKMLAPPPKRDGSGADAAPDAFIQSCMEEDWQADKQARETK